MSVESELTAALAYQRQTNGKCQTIIGMALEEVRRLRFLIRYALDGPEDVESYRKILNDALNAVTGGDDAEAVRSEVQWLREEVERLRQERAALAKELSAVLHL